MQAVQFATISYLDGSIMGIFSTSNEAENAKRRKGYDWVRYYLPDQRRVCHYIPSGYYDPEVNQSAEAR